jgi:SAM-dependent methyltransferase
LIIPAEADGKYIFRNEDERHMHCHICGSANLVDSYTGPIRAGGVDSGYIDDYDVKRCEDCTVEFLDPFDDALLNHYDYKTDEYWQGHQGLKSPEEIYEQHDPIQLTWLYKIGVNRFRNHRMADYGCGAGQFLDMLLGVADQTVAVDPAEHFHDHLSEKGHRVFSYASDLEDESIDLGVSFTTAEHLEDPVSFFKSVGESLREGGDFFVGVPNQHDFLIDLVPAFESFYYRRSHLFYFTVRALETALQRAGFEIVDEDHMHKWNLMNMVGWALDGEPGGHPVGGLFDSATEDIFRRNVEREGISSHILVHARRPKD